MREALRLAPSACNLQPWTFIFVQDAALRRSLADACRKQSFLAEAPVIVVGVGHPERAYKKMRGEGNSVEVDVAIALDHLTLAAAAEGIGTCWIGAFSEGPVKDLLGIPKTARVVAITALGFPADHGLLRPAREGERKPDSELFRTDRY
jgi:nitroreductase